jgi:hypothetical protein
MARERSRVLRPGKIGAWQECAKHTASPTQGRALLAPARAFQKTEVSGAVRQMLGELAAIGFLILTIVNSSWPKILESGQGLLDTASNSQSPPLS